MLKVFVLSALLISLATLPAYAEKTEKTSAPKRTSAEEEKILEQRKRTTAARKDLNGSSWQVELQPTGSKGKAEKDKFTFQDGMFKSDYYIGRGYTPTNYAINMLGAETEEAIWETMLSSKEGQIFIRGQWEKDKMYGNVTEQLEGGKKVVERYFTTQARKAIPTESKSETKKENEGDPKAIVAQEESSALVSKEEPLDVTPFVPGTTDERR